MHQNNAVFTILGCWWVVALTGNVMLSTCAFSSETGIVLGAASDGAKVPSTVGNLQVYNAGSVAMNQSIGVSPNAWNFFGIAVDESALTGYSFTNGSGGSITPNYSSPAAGAASQTLRSGRAGTSASYSANNARMAMAAIIQGTALTSTQIQAIYADVKAMRPGYGLP